MPPMCPVERMYRPLNPETMNFQSFHSVRAPAQGQSPSFAMSEETVTVESLQLLIAQKDAIESELLATRSWLTSPGNLGLSGGLVDSEGFPINDVEKIIATREARGKLART